MKKIIGFLVLVCCFISLYFWIFEPDNIVVNGAGTSISKDAYGNNIDENGFVIPEYTDDELSGDFYEAASKPFGFIKDVATAFDSFRSGIVDMIEGAGSLSETLREIFNFDEEGSWWDKLLEKGQGE